MQVHVDEFEYIQKEIKFHSESLKSQDINIAFLFLLGDSEMWKNFRNSNFHRAIKLKPSNLFVEVIFINEINVFIFSQLEFAKALIIFFNSGRKGKQNKWKWESFYHEEICEDCQMSEYIIENCLKKYRFCFKYDYIIEYYFKRRWIDKQWFSKRSIKNNIDNINNIQKNYNSSLEFSFKYSIKEFYSSSKNNFK